MGLWVNDFSLFKNLFKVLIKFLFLALSWFLNSITLYTCVYLFSSNFFCFINETSLLKLLHKQSRNKNIQWFEEDGLLFPHLPHIPISNSHVALFFTYPQGGECILEVEFQPFHTAHAMNNQMLFLLPIREWNWYRAWKKVVE